MNKQAQKLLKRCRSRIPVLKWELQESEQDGYIVLLYRANVNGYEFEEAFTLGLDSVEIFAQHPERFSHYLWFMVDRLAERIWRTKKQPERSAEE